MSQEMTLERKDLITKIQDRFKDVRCAQVEQLLSVMSNPLRFHILCALTQGEFTVTELVEITSAKNSNLSQQLKIMTMAGYLTKVRRGKEIIYTLADQRIHKTIALLETIFT